MQTIYIVVFITLFLSSIAPPVEAESVSPSSECCSSSCKSRRWWQQRLASANQLIADGTRIAGKTRALKGEVSELDVKKVSWSDYKKLFNQYQAELSAYKQHMKAYFKHCKQYHAQQPEIIAPTPTPHSFDPFGGKLRPLRLRVSDKCKELQMLETRLMKNERLLAGYMEELMVASQKESLQVYSGIWKKARQLALTNQPMASRYNHLAIQKSSGRMSSVHDMITDANRSGAYGEHVAAFRDYARVERLQQEIFKHSKMHGRFAVMTISRLNAMQPPNPSQVDSAYTGSQLEAESKALDSEHERLKMLFGRLETMQKSLPRKKGKGAR